VALRFIFFVGPPIFGMAAAVCSTPPHAWVFFSSSSKTIKCFYIFALCILKNVNFPSAPLICQGRWPHTVCAGWDNPPECLEQAAFALFTPVQGAQKARNLQKFSQIRCDYFPKYRDADDPVAFRFIHQSFAKVIKDAA
jgi:hypothetical protein